MKRTAILSACLWILLSALPAQAESIYLSGKFGATGRFDNSLGVSNILFDMGVGFQSALGYDFEGPYRLELEVGYNQNNFSGTNTLNGNTSTGRYEGFTFMGNGYFDVPLHLLHLDLPVTPYIGVGLGASVVRVTTNSPNFVGLTADSDTDLLPAWQWMVGFQTDLTPQWALTGELRIQYTQDPNLNLSGANVDTSYEVQELLFGVRYRF